MPPKLLRLERCPGGDASKTASHCSQLASRAFETTGAHQSDALQRNFNHNGTHCSAMREEYMLQLNYAPGNTLHCSEWYFSEEEYMLDGVKYTAIESHPQWTALQYNEKRIYAAVRYTQQCSEEGCMELNTMRRECTGGECAMHL